MNCVKEQIFRMPFAIETHNLTKQYRSQNENHPAVQGLDLTIKSGVLYGLAGPDSAGKSTTNRTLAPVILLTSGEAQISGYGVTNQSWHADRCNLHQRSIVVQ